MKTLRWIYFGLGSVGAIRCCITSWRHLDYFNALLVTGMAVSLLLEWLGDTLAYQWDIPRSERR